MAVSVASLSATQETTSVKVEDSTAVNGSKLTLNGAGTRCDGPFKVYVTGLDTGRQASTLDEVVNQPGPKRLRPTLVREIDVGGLGKLLYRGVEDNVGKSEISKLIPGLIKMGDLFSTHKKLLPGDTFTIDWVPGVGTTITVQGKVDGEVFKEPEFFKALMAIWLWTVPADFRLKDALLATK